MKMDGDTWARHVEACIVNMYPWVNNLKKERKMINDEILGSGTVRTTRRITCPVDGDCIYPCTVVSVKTFSGNTCVEVTDDTGSTVSVYSAGKWDLTGCLKATKAAVDVTMEEVCEKFGYDVKIKKED